MHMVRDFISLGQFPGKYSWKTITNGKLTEQRDLKFFSEIAENRLDRLLMFHPGIRPNYFWELSRKHLGLLPACKSVVKLMVCYLIVIQGRSVRLFSRISTHLLGI